MTSRKAQYSLAKLLHDLKDEPTGLGKKFKYKPKNPKKRDWFAYNEAQVNEMNEFLVLVKNMVDDARRRLDYIDDRDSISGQQPKCPFDLAKAVLVQQFYQASNRVAAGLARMFKEKLNMKEDITYKDLERAYSNRDVQDILDEVLKMSNEPISGKETKFSIDGTGMPTSIKQNYESDKGEDKKRSAYRMLIGMVGIEHKMFSAVVVNGPGSESPFLVPLLGETAAQFERIDLVVGDAAFYSHENCNKIAECRAKPRIYPRIDAVINSDGSSAKKQMLLDLVNDAQSWLEEYHQRSISEDVHSVLKCRFPRPFMKRRMDRLDNEGMDKICAYNLRMLIYNHYIRDVKVKWLMPT
jgi:transposase